jgi:lon-related putative ATP-dependent protease
MTDSALKIPVEQLTWHCDAEQLEFGTTDELPDLEGLLGQERALRAIDFGLNMHESGFNIYISGETGTGRASAIRCLLEKRAITEPTPSDWCYVYDFASPDRPLALELPAGSGNALEREMREFLDGIRADIPKSLESKEYEIQKGKVLEEYQEKNSALFAGLERDSTGKGFTIQRTVSGLVMVPQKEGRNYTQEEYDALTDTEKETLDSTGLELTDNLNDVLRQVRENDKGAKEALAKLDRDLGLAAVGQHLQPLRKNFAVTPKVLTYLESVQEDVILNLEEFKPLSQPQSPIPGFRLPHQEPNFDRYRVNVFVDNRENCGAPVVFEPNPTYNNLFGRIEHEMQAGGVATTNFTMIKPGALHRANGGYLIIDAREVLTNPFVWDSLKRSIRNTEIKIEDVTEQYRFMTIVSLKPEPIPLTTKIVMIGTPYIYYLLFYLEPDYRKFFKVKADFDSRIDRTPQAMHDYALFVATICRNEGLLHVDRSGVAALLEQSAREMEDQNKLSSRFMEIADLIREAGFWAKRDNAPFVTREYVRQAIEEKNYRSNRLEERLREMITDGTIMVDTEGSEVGQINGLAVMTLGDHTFGSPSRITSRVYLGRAGMVNIEREAKLSGPIHDKGVMILTGYLGGTFARERQLSFSATICFEQSYDGIEGDSASSTELYALLSALSGLPLSQGIAVTGSVNQLGRIQPIGGVNQKIEGFFQLCRIKGFTGSQGVMIPKSNERNLMLRDEVIQAVQEGKFHLWSVETVNQGIELLTGVPAGEPQADGSFPEGTVNFLVDKRLQEMQEKMLNQAERADNSEKK